MAVNKEQLTVRLKPSTIATLKKIADEREETISEYVRKLLENHLLTR